MKGLTRNKFNALVQIAAIDGHIADEELEIINKLAAEHGFSDENIKYIIENPEPLGDFDDLNEEEKLEFMHISLCIMQADELVFNSEVSYCKSIAEKLGIDPALVDVYATRTTTDLKTFLKEAKRYVKA